MNAAETVASKFRAQLKELMRQIAATKCRYVRCIRPNDEALAMGHEDIVTTLAKHELIGSTRLRFAVEQDDHKGLPQLLGRWRWPTACALE